jgi:hypothetical protein
MLIHSGWGDELLPVNGHLGDREPMVKPTSTEAGFFMNAVGKEVSDSKNKKDKRNL